MNAVVKDVQTFRITRLLCDTDESGVLQDQFALEGNILGRCNKRGFRRLMRETLIVLDGAQFHRGFGLSFKPIDWNPRVGDEIEVNTSQM